MRRAILAMTLLTAACSPGATEPTTPPQGVETVSVATVLDGDSIDTTTGFEIRLLGINAPERDECWTAEARTALADLLAGHSISLEPSGSDQFGRLLGYLFADGTNVNLRMVEEGHAIALSVDHRLGGRFLAAEEEAYRERRGLWGGDACGSPITSPAVEILSVDPNPPGPDGSNLGKETVTIANRGASTDLTGWVLRDESSTHRYVFPPLVLATGASLVVHTGCGRDDQSDLYWCAGSPVWNNGGDMILLLDASGAVAARRRYSGD